MLNKKAQGISINTIIIAAIALIVLVVLITIFTGYTGQWGTRVGKVQAKVCESVTVQGQSSLGGHWTTNTCADGKEAYPTDSDDLQTHGTQHCCLS